MDNRILVPAAAACFWAFGSIAGAQTGNVTSGTGPSAATTSPAASDTQSSDLDRIVCKSGPPPTGTRIGTGRECHTQREWDRRMHEQQQELTRQQINKGCTSGGC